MNRSPFVRPFCVISQASTQHKLSQAGSAAYAQGAALVSRAAASLERALTGTAATGCTLTNNFAGNCRGMSRTHDDGGIASNGAVATGQLRHCAAYITAPLFSILGAILARMAAGLATILRAWYWLQAFLVSGDALSYVAQSYEASVAAALSLPRTFRTAKWAICAGLSYKAFLARYPGHAETDEPFASKLSDLHVCWAERLLIVCRANRGLYVKAGQFASAFGAVPREFRTVLSGLEDRAKPRPYVAIRQVLVEELGPEAEANFEYFEQVATAAASLAQVHKARLVGGQAVAIKVQYPGLRSAVQADLWTMKALSRAARWFFPSYSLDWLFDELEAKLTVELDFRNEVSNAQRLRSIIGSLPSVNLPMVQEPMCTSRVIVMEWVDGCKITDVEALQALQINPRQVGLKLTSLFSEMTFIHGYIHGDPHPGNLMIRPRGSKSILSWLLHGTRQPFEIVLLDHGTYLAIDSALREQYCALWCAFVMRDKPMAVDVASALAGERAGKMLPLLLMHQAKDRGEERRLQREVGVNGFGDITRLLATASRDLVELLRINGVLRSVTAKLNITMVDRVRICGAAARRGLPARGSTGATLLHEKFESLAFRLRLRTMMAAVCGYCWARGIFRRTALYVLNVFGDAIFED